MLSRGEAVKKLWEYIKEKELQNPADKRVILCDSKLEQLFKRKKINMFKMSAELASVSCCCLGVTGVSWIWHVMLHR
jgi:upstream activation factor subunit UAF30